MSWIVDSSDPTTLFEAFGDPRSFDRFDSQRLEDGDFAVLVEAKPGAIYFMRPKNGKKPETAFDGDVVMTRLLLGPNATRGKAFILSFEDRFEIEKEMGKDMDGIQVPFWIFKRRLK